MNSKIKYVAIALIIIISTVGVAMGVNYVLQVSSQVPVTTTSGSVLVPVSLTVNATTLTDLDRLNLTATITDIHGLGLTVTFKDGLVPIGQAVIANVAGTYKAELIVQPSAGSHIYTAGPA
jgi:uncharacterized transporter YbjL